MLLKQKGKAVLAIGFICAVATGLAEAMKAVADKVAPDPDKAKEE